MHRRVHVLCVKTSVLLNKNKSKLSSKLLLLILLFLTQGRGWSSWFKHCATRRKTVGSIPDEVIRIFHLPNPSVRNMALVDSPSNEKWVPGISPGDKGGRSVGLTLPPTCIDCLQILAARPVGLLTVRPGLYTVVTTQQGRQLRNSSISGRGNRFSSSPKRLDGLRIKPGFLFNGYSRHSLEVRRLEREGDLSHPTKH